MKRGGPLKRKAPLKQGGTLKRSPMKRRRSTRGRQVDVEYASARSDFGRAQPWCEIGLWLDGVTDWGCSRRTQEVHHVVNRSQAPWLITDPRNFAGLCRACHHHVTVNPAWAKENGWSLPSLRIPDYSRVDGMWFDGALMAQVEKGSELELIYGSRIFTELFIMGHCAGLYEPGKAIVARNGNHADARLCNAIAIQA